MYFSLHAFSGKGFWARDQSPIELTCAGKLAALRLSLLLIIKQLDLIAV